MAQTWLMLKMLYCGEEADCSRLGLIPTTLPPSHIPPLPSHCTVHTTVHLSTVLSCVCFGAVRVVIISVYKYYIYMCVCVCCVCVLLLCVCVCVCVFSRHQSRWRRHVLAVPVWSLDWSCNHSETALPQPVHYMQCVMYHTHYACDAVYPHVFCQSLVTRTMRMKWKRETLP